LEGSKSGGWTIQPWILRLSFDDSKEISSTWPVYLREQFLIERGENFHRSHVGDSDVAGIVRTPIGEGDHAGVGEGKGAAAAGAGRRSKMIGIFLKAPSTEEKPILESP